MTIITPFRQLPRDRTQDHFDRHHAWARSVIWAWPVGLMEKRQRALFVLRSILLAPSCTICSMCRGRGGGYSTRTPCSSNMQGFLSFEKKKQQWSTQCWAKLTGTYYVSFLCTERSQWFLSTILTNTRICRALVVYFLVLLPGPRLLLHLLFSSLLEEIRGFIASSSLTWCLAGRCMIRWGCCRRWHLWLWWSSGRLFSCGRVSTAASLIGGTFLTAWGLSPHLGYDVYWLDTVCFSWDCAWLEKLFLPALGGFRPLFPCPFLEIREPIERTHWKQNHFREALHCHQCEFLYIFVLKIEGKAKFFAAHRKSLGSCISTCRRWKWKQSRVKVLFKKHSWC